MKRDYWDRELSLLGRWAAGRAVALVLAAVLVAVGTAGSAAFIPEWVIRQSAGAWVSAFALLSVGVLLVGFGLGALSRRAAGAAVVISVTGPGQNATAFREAAAAHARSLARDVFIYGQGIAVRRPGETLGLELRLVQAVVGVQLSAVAAHRIGRRLALYVQAPLAVAFGLGQFLKFQTGRDVTTVEQSAQAPGRDFFDAVDIRDDLRRVRRPTIPAIPAPTGLTAVTAPPSVGSPLSVFLPGGGPNTAVIVQATSAVAMTQHALLHAAGAPDLRIGQALVFVPAVDFLDERKETFETALVQTCAVVEAWLYGLGGSPATYLYLAAPAAFAVGLGALIGKSGIVPMDHAPGADGAYTYRPLTAPTGGSST